jgi:cytochrome c oxidase subunit II
VGPHLTERTERRRGRRGRPLRRSIAAFAGSLGALTLSACSQEEVEQLKALGLPAGPDGASSASPYMYDLWIGAWIAAGVVGALVWGLIIYAVIRYRRRGDDEVPVQVRYNLPIEALYTIAPFVVIFVFFYHTVVAQDAIQPEEEYDHEVLVVGQQWSWTFNYLGEDGEGGSDDVFEPGTIADPPRLVLPVDETVKFRFVSPDVIHSFWIPAFYFKMDVIPGRENTWITTPTVTGELDGRCAELCGISHSRMLFDVEVVERSEYDAYLADLAALGNTGVAKGTSEGDISGLDTGSVSGEEGAE